MITFASLKMEWNTFPVDATDIFSCAEGKPMYRHSPWLLSFIRRLKIDESLGNGDELEQNVMKYTLLFRIRYKISRNNSIWTIFSLTMINRSIWKQFLSAYKMWIGYFLEMPSLSQTSSTNALFGQYVREIKFIDNGVFEGQINFPNNAFGKKLQPYVEKSMFY